MKLGTRARYSVRLMTAITKLSRVREPVPLNEAARHCGLSRRYLDQLVPALRNSGLLKGKMGRGGGYVLAREPESIRLREIIEAAIGPIAIVDCVEGPDYCIHTEFCTCRSLWNLINSRICLYLERFTLAEMAADDWHQRIELELAALTDPPRT